MKKLDMICKNLICKTAFGLMNHKKKFCKNFFLSLIDSAVFKLSDFLTIFLFFRLFDNALMKAYSLYGRCSGKKSFKETEICGVIVSKWILLIWRFFLLSQIMNWVSSISHLHYESKKKKKKYENVLEFRQQICLWNILIVWWGIDKYPSQCFPVNLNSFYVKIGEPLTKISKLLTVSRRLSSLNFFFLNSFESKDSFCCPNVEIKF